MKSGSTRDIWYGLMMNLGGSHGWTWCNWPTIEGRRSLFGGTRVVHPFSRFCGLLLQIDNCYHTPLWTRVSWPKHFEIIDHDIQLMQLIEKPQKVQVQCTLDLESLRDQIDLKIIIICMASYMVTSEYYFVIYYILHQAHQE